MYSEAHTKYLYDLHNITQEYYVGDASISILRARIKSSTLCGS